MSDQLDLTARLIKANTELADVVAELLDSRRSLAAELAQARADAERWHNLCKRVIASRDSGVVIGGPESVYSVEKDIRAALSAGSQYATGTDLRCPKCKGIGPCSECNPDPRAGLTVETSR